MLVTLPLARIATVPVPLKFTQALAIYKGAVPDTVATCAEFMFGVVSVGLDMVIPVNGDVSPADPIVLTGMVVLYLKAEKCTYSTSAVAPNADVLKRQAEVVGATIVFVVPAKFITTTR